MKPEEVVDRQLDYYNKNILDPFCDTYSDDIEIFNLTSGERLLSGKKELYAKYDYRFNVQKVKAKIKNRIVIGNTVIDEEEVSGIIENDIVRVVAIYQVANNLIHKVYLLYDAV